MSNREFQIKAKQSAIQRRLAQSNAKNKAAAEKKAGKGKTATWSTQYVKGKDKGYTESDFGVGKGAAIPYSVGTTNKNNKPVKKAATPPPRSSGRTPTSTGGSAVDIWKYKRKNTTNTPL